MANNISNNVCTTLKFLGYILWFLKAHKRMNEHERLAVTLHKELILGIHLKYFVFHIINCSFKICFKMSPLSLPAALACCCWAFYDSSKCGGVNTTSPSCGPCNGRWSRAKGASMGVSSGRVECCKQQKLVTGGCRFSEPHLTIGDWQLATGSSTDLLAVGQLSMAGGQLWVCQ